MRMKYRNFKLWKSNLIFRLRIFLHVNWNIKYFDGKYTPNILIRNISILSIYIYIYIYLSIYLFSYKNIIIYLSNIYYSWTPCYQSIFHIFAYNGVLNNNSFHYNLQLCNILPRYNFESRYRLKCSFTPDFRRVVFQT